VGRALDGTGFLVPRTGGALLTACTWTTSKWPEMARHGDVLVRVSAGRYGDDRVQSMDDADIVRRAVDELRPALALRGEPLETLVTRWPDAFPQYAVGHVERVEAMETAAAALPALALAGAALRGVGIPACIDSGRRAARAVLGQLEARPSPTP
ncbi:MAG: FAD-dependent oxidoreductase, partial [Acidimicrobiales bacterium]